MPRRHFPTEVKHVLPGEAVGGGQDEINRLFGNARENDSSSATAMSIPLVNIHEYAHEYADRFELYVDLPGVDPSTVELTLDGGILTLSGERPQPTRKDNEEAQGRRVERHCLVLPGQREGDGGAQRLAVVMLWEP